MCGVGLALILFAVQIQGVGGLVPALPFQTLPTTIKCLLSPVNSVGEWIFVPLVTVIEENGLLNLLPLVQS